MKNYLFPLFEACLSKSYRETENGGSWAFDRFGETLFLWFQQSHGVTDWLNNLNFHATPYHEMTPQWYCHAGFLSVWKSILPHLTSLIEDGNVKRICTVGYSHGAALAVLCHEYVWYHRPDLRDRICGFGFGCPRVLHGCVPEEVAIRWEHFFVIRNLDDIVTHLPPRVSGFCHVGKLVEVGSGGKYSAIDAHRPESYLRELAANAPTADNV